MHLLRHRVLGHGLGQHLVGDLAQLLQHLVGQRLGDHTLVLHQVVHRLGVVALAPGFADDVAGRGGVLDHRLQVLGQLVPGRLVDQQFGDRGGLVPAGRVVVLGGLVQAELAVLERADELGRVDDTALQRREDLAAGQQLDVDAERRVDLPGQPGDAHLQALQVGAGLDLLLEPAGHLHAGVAARQGDHAERRVDLVPQLLATAVVEPAVDALEVQPERHRA